MIPLTPRETEIWRLLAEGRSNQQIADALGITRGTISTHLATLYRLLGVSGSGDARVAAARLWGERNGGEK